MLVAIIYDFKHFFLIVNIRGKGDLGFLVGTGVPGVPGVLGVLGGLEVLGVQ